MCVFFVFFYPYKSLVSAPTLLVDVRLPTALQDQVLQVLWKNSSNVILFYPTTHPYPHHLRRLVAQPCHHRERPGLIDSVERP